MKFCQKCGNQVMDEAVVCPSCGCAIEKKVFAKEVSYDDCVKGAVTTNIISAVVIALGIVCWLLINMWIGAILCLVAEFIALIPNSKVQKAFKQNGLTGNSKEAKTKKKEIVKDLNKKSRAYSFSKVLSVIALVLLIIFVLFIQFIQ